MGLLEGIFDEEQIGKILKKKDRNMQRIKYTNIIAFAERLLIEADRGRRHPIYAYIRSLTDYIMIGHVNDSIGIGEIGHCYTSFTYFMERMRRENLVDSIPVLEAKTSVDLSVDPVLVFPWETSRLVEAMKNYGTENIPWVEQGEHYTALWLPIGVLEIAENGNHSIFTGAAKREGTIHIDTVGIDTTKEFPKHYVYSFEGLYEHVYFEGIDFRRKDGDRRIGFPQEFKYLFEFGCLFEIGRLMKMHNISFLDIEKSEA